MSSNTTSTVLFNTQELIESAQKVIDAKKVAEDDYERRRTNYYERHLTDWKIQKTRNVRKMRDYLTKCLRADKAPIMKEIDRLLGPARYRNNVDDRYIYEKPSIINVEKGQAVYGDPERDLEALVAMLKAHQGAQVSASQLRGLGFKSRTIVALFRDLARAQVSKQKESSESVI